MPLKKRLQIGTAALACAAAVVSAAQAAAPAALSPDDARRYAAAFEASDRGDFIDAQMQAAEIRDKSLVGYLSFRQLMHPTAHRASFDELAAWLARFRDLPLAGRVFSLAARRKPAEAGDAPGPAVPLVATASSRPATATAQARRAQDAYYAGNARRALALASASGERWIGGLAAYRLGAYERALTSFRALARDAGEDPSIRAAAAYWGARAAMALGDTPGATAELRLAAQSADTFYGMIAARQLQLQDSDGLANLAGPRPDLVRVDYVQPWDETTGLMARDPRAHRAAALAQIGRLQEAGHELYAGLTLARSDAERERWKSLGITLGAPLAAPSGVAGAPSTEDYPLPPLAPKSGFTIDKALVYAIVRQESRFNPMAVSPVGAIGLMQLMPEAAARAAGDDKLKLDMSPLFDPAFNLRVGQDYLTWLMERGVGFDLLRTVAAYNGGPGMVHKTAQLLGDQADPLLLIETLPARETRNYVERVMAAYWRYKAMFGEEARTLDALASGSRMVDARLDLTQPSGRGTQLSGEPLQSSLR